MRGARLGTALQDPGDFGRVGRRRVALLVDRFLQRRLSVNWRAFIGCRRVKDVGAEAARRERRDAAGERFQRCGHDGLAPPLRHGERGAGLAHGDVAYLKPRLADLAVPEQGFCAAWGVGVHDVSVLTASRRCFLRAGGVGTRSIWVAAHHNRA